MSFLKNMNAQCLNVIGLLSDIIGAIILSYGLIISKKEAIKLGVSRISGNTDEDNLELPQVKDRLKQSKNALMGLIFLIIGFILQIVANLLPS